MRILGLDVGSKTIGVAVSDELNITAQGVTTIKRKRLDEDVIRVLKLIDERNIGAVVVGLPKNMNGSIGPSARMVLSFIEELEKRTETPVITWDERLSTVAAEKALLEADVSRKVRKKVIDTVAAIIILQGYLDSRTHVEERS